MGYIDDKLDIIEEDKKKSSSDKPRQWLKKHMYYADGSPKFKLLKADDKGVPLSVEITGRMDGTKAVWNRIQKSDKDYLFEKE